VGGVYAIIVVIIYICDLNPVACWTTLMIAILLLSGMQLLILGIICEYIWRTLDASRKRAVFFIDSITSGDRSGG